ncbi:unnamed protein product, partial [Owenia fusiformis]
EELKYGNTNKKTADRSISTFSSAKSKFPMRTHALVLLSVTIFLFDRASCIPLRQRREQRSGRREARSNSSTTERSPSSLQIWNGCTGSSGSLRHNWGPRSHAFDD